MFNVSVLPQPTNYKPLIEAYPKAADIQASAAQQASQIGTNFLNQGLGAVNTGAQQATQTVSPYLSAGNSAVNSLAGMTGAGGAAAQQAAYQNFQANPAYQFNLNEQLESLQKYFGGRGKAYSGQAIKAAQDRAAGLASQEYNTQVQNQQNFLNSLNPFAQQQANRNYLQGTDQANIYDRIGNTQAGGILAAAGAQAGGLLGAANARTLASAQPNIQTTQQQLSQSSPLNNNPSPWGNTSSGSMIGGGGSSGGGGSYLGGSTGIYGSSPYGQGQNFSFSGGAGSNYNPGQQAFGNNLLPGGSNVGGGSSATNNYSNAAGQAGSYLGQPTSGPQINELGAQQAGSFLGGSSFSNVANQTAGPNISGGFNQSTNQVGSGSGGGGLNGNPGGNVPQETWDVLDPKYQTQVSDAYDRAINSGSSVWQQYQAMLAEARKLPGPAQNALIEAANAMSSSLRQ